MPRIPNVPQDTEIMAAVPTANHSSPREEPLPEARLPQSPVLERVEALGAEVRQLQASVAQMSSLLTIVAENQAVLAALLESRAGSIRYDLRLIMQAEKVVGVNQDLPTLEVREDHSLKLSSR